MKLYKAIISEDVRELIQRYVASMKKNNLSRQERYRSMLWVRFADLGFDKPHIDNMVNDLKDTQTEKDVDVFMSRYKLWGDDYADSFKPTEATLANALAESLGKEEEIDGVSYDVKTYQAVLQIPYTTEKNKNQKIRKLKFDLGVKGIKISKKKELEVDEINPENEENTSLEYVVVLEIETEMSRNELENTLEPDYKILKLKVI